MAFGATIVSQFQRSEPSLLSFDVQIHVLLRSAFRAIIGFQFEVQSRISQFDVQIRISRFDI